MAVPPVLDGPKLRPREGDAPGSPLGPTPTARGVLLVSSPAHRLPESAPPARGATVSAPVERLGDRTRRDQCGDIPDPDFGLGIHGPKGIPREGAPNVAPEPAVGGVAGRTLFLGGMAIPVGQDDNLARFTWSQLRGFQTGGARLLPRGQECDGHPATTSVPEGRRTIRGAGARSPAPAASNGGVGAPVFLAPPPATGGTTLSPDYRVPSGDIDLTPSTIRLRYRSTELVVDRAFYGDWADDHALLIRACMRVRLSPRRDRNVA